MEPDLAPSGSAIRKIISKTIKFDVEKILKKVTSARFIRKCVGLSMMCYTFGNADKTCLGERQLRGRMGKLL